MLICPYSDLSFEITDKERELYGRFDLPVSDIHPIVRFVMRFAHGNKENYDRWIPLIAARSIHHDR